MRGGFGDDAHIVLDAVLASELHDLRPPLTTINGLAHEIAEHGDERAKVVEQEADRLDTPVGKLVDLARFASGAAIEGLEVDDVEGLIGAAAQQAVGVFGGRRLHVELDEVEAEMFAVVDFSERRRATPPDAPLPTL